MVTQAQLKKLAKEYGTPLFVVDHDQLRKNLAEFKKFLPKVQPYFAVKSNSLPEIVRTLYQAGASFDVASIAEFRTVYENIRSTAWPGSAPNFEDSSTIAPVFGTLMRNTMPACGAYFFTLRISSSLSKVTSGL